MACCVWALEKEEITEHISQIEEQFAKGWLAVMMKSLRPEELVRVTVTLWAFGMQGGKLFIKISIKAHS
jgi:hypothetical protein